MSFQFNPTEGWNNTTEFPDYPARDQVRPLLQRLFDQIKTWINSHKTETLTQTIIITRDISISGQQVVGGFLGVPKYLAIRAILPLTKHISLGSLSQGGTKTALAYVPIIDAWNQYTTPSIMFDKGGADAVTGDIEVIDNNTITINWTITGTSPPTGIATIFIDAFYHGGA